MSIAPNQLPEGLPPGRLITPESGGEPGLWVSDEPLYEADAGARWADLLARHPHTGVASTEMVYEFDQARGRGVVK
ncbi:hypothetical protein GCM10010411_96000 [Actinomadura fulvescens]|uniref:Uncharacterized protein n=1 Tax=Actinomadura fulvescens TaxID=46160 RepID=A0ABP6DDV9_9ACTN